jgi:HEPN domain-containing protein
MSANASVANFSGNTSRNSWAAPQAKVHKRASRAIATEIRRADPAFSAPEADCFRTDFLTSSTTLVSAALWSVVELVRLEHQSGVENTKQAARTTLSRAYALQNKGQDREAAFAAMQFIQFSIQRADGLMATNVLLAEADINELGSRSLIGILRSTYQLRAKLPAWDRTYSKSWQRIRELGKSPDALFLGMPKAAEMTVAEE